MRAAERQRLPATSAGDEASVAPNRVTVRAVVVGVASVAVLSFVAPYLSLVIRSWIVGGGSLMNGPVVVLFLLVALNGVLVRFHSKHAFSRTELLVIYIMMIVSVGFLLWGGLPFLISAVTYPFYMATPENNWQHLLLPYIPSWLQLSDAGAVVSFWEGLPRGAGVPWHAWVQPGVAWSGFTLALMAAMFCLGALLSRGWIERQRLTFPLVDVPLAIAGDHSQPTLRASVMGRGVFWIGFAVPSAVGLVGWLHRFLPALPAINLVGIDIGRNFVGMGLPWSALSSMRFSIMFEAIGIACLLPNEVSLSLWLFYVLFKVVALVSAMLGTSAGAAGTSYSLEALLDYVEYGAFVSLGALLLFEAREPIWRAWRGLVALFREEAAPHGPLAGSAALLGFILANGSMLWFGVHAGMQWWALLLLLALFYPVLLGASRAVAAAGVMTLAQGATSRMVAARAFGAASFSPTTIVMYASISGIFMDTPFNLAMPQMMNSFKLAHSGRIRGGALPWLTGIAIAVMLAVGLPAMLKMVYTYGAGTLGRWPFAEWPSAFIFVEADATLRTPEIVEGSVRLALLAGAAVMLGLVWLSGNVLWWPVSPIGFLMANSWEFENWVWSNALIAWVITTIIRRYGGLRLYRSVRPAFLGLVLGTFLSDGFIGLLNTVVDFRRLSG